MSAPAPTAVATLPSPFETPSTATTPPNGSASHKSPVKPPKKPSRTEWLIPVLKFRAKDLSSLGVSRFLETIPNVTVLLREAIISVCAHLYVEPSNQPTYVKQLTLHLHPFSGVAYTSGSKHKKAIHLSSTYIAELTCPLGPEITGVIRHEMVHVFQCDGDSTCPGGLIEGIADWIRLKDGFIPEHWKQGGTRWDDGYQHTAYFLDYCESKYGEGTVRGINRALRKRKYDAGIWDKILGREPAVETLWKEYRAEAGLPEDDEDGEGGEEEEWEDEDGDEETVDETASMSDSPDSELASNSDSDSDSNSDPSSDGVVVVKHEESKSKHTKVYKSSGVPDSLPSPPTPFENPLQFQGETAVSEIFRERLKDLVFDGKIDGKRFIREFEGLVKKVHPDISDEDKRLLLVTSFRGDQVNEWYETHDLEDKMPYSKLANELQAKFKGVKRNRLLIAMD